MLRIYPSLASLVALAAASTDGGSGANPAPIAKADPAPAPQADAGSAPPAPTPAAPAVVGPAPGADVNPPANKADAKKAARDAKKSEAKAEAKTVVMVWAQPGHETFGVGVMIRTPEELGENLRAAGRARYASEAEIKAAGDKVADVEGL